MTATPAPTTAAMRVHAHILPLIAMMATLVPPMIVTSVQDAPTPQLLATTIMNALPTLVRVRQAACLRRLPTVRLAPAMAVLALRMLAPTEHVHIQQSPVMTTTNVLPMLVPAQQVVCLRLLQTTLLAPAMAVPALRMPAQTEHVHI